MISDRTPYFSIEMLEEAIATPGEVKGYYMGKVGGDPEKRKHITITGVDSHFKDPSSREWKRCATYTCWKGGRLLEFHREINEFCERVVYLGNEVYVAPILPSPLSTRNN